MWKCSVLTESYSIFLHGYYSVNDLPVLTIDPATNFFSSSSYFCWVSLGVSLLMLTWYRYVRNTNCPKTPIPRPEEKRGEPRATVPLTGSNYSEGPVSTLFLLKYSVLRNLWNVQFESRQNQWAASPVLAEGTKHGLNKLWRSNSIFNYLTYAHL
jgi:hypothetical protein